MPIIIFSMTVFNIPGKAMAEYTETTVKTTAETTVEAGAEAAVDAAEEQMSETAYRIKPLQEQLAQMTDAAIDIGVNKFADMDKHWSRKVVGKLTGLGIIAGYDGKFWPGNQVQADQFIKMAIMAMGYKIEQGTDYWAQPYIETALSEGLVEKGEFADYKKPLTREQMARIIVRAALKVDEKPDGQYDPYIIGKVADYEQIDDNLKQHVLDSYKLGLIQGSGSKFRPKDTLTRAEAAAVIIRILDTAERKPTVPGEDEIIRVNDTLDIPVVIYPGSVRELFDVAKATEAAIPKAKGHIYFTIGNSGKYISATMYKDEATFKQNIMSFIATFKIAYNDSTAVYAYDLTVYNDELYAKLFPDFTREIFKTIFEKDAQKAIKLHDQYMTQRYTRTDGYNDYTQTVINNRATDFLRFNDAQFGIHIKLKGVK